MTPPSDLIERVEKGEHTYVLECELWRTLIGEGQEPDRPPPPYLGSVDAALALVERVLPGVFWDEPLYGVKLLFGTDEKLGVAEHDNLPRAIILALLRSLQAKEEGNG